MSAPMQIQPAILGAVVGATLGGLIGWATGRLTKQIEFRFDLLQKLADNFQRTKRAAAEYGWALDRLKEPLVILNPEKRRSAEEEAGKLRGQVQFSLSEALTFTYLVAAAFEDASDHWRALMTRFTSVFFVDNSGEAVRASLNLAIDEWSKFARAAVRKLGFWPWDSWSRGARRILTAGKELDEPQESTGGRRS